MYTKYLKYYYFWQKKKNLKIQVSVINNSPSSIAKKKKNLNFLSACVSATDSGIMYELS